MMSDRPNPVDLPEEPNAACPECFYQADYKTACELEGKCPECFAWLENDDE